MKKTRLTPGYDFRRCGDLAFEYPGGVPSMMHLVIGVAEGDRRWDQGTLVTLEFMVGGGIEICCVRSENMQFQIKYLIRR